MFLVQDERLVLADTNLMEVKALNQAYAELEAKVRLANQLKMFAGSQTDESAKDFWR